MPASVRRIWRSGAWFLALLQCAAASSAYAQERGFAVDRYEGNTAGSWLFLVDRPWYSDTRWFAVELTLDGELNPLVPAVPTGGGGVTPIVSQALRGHVDVAGSFVDRLQLHASLPVTLFELGTPEPVSQSGPLSGPALGDPRFGARARLFGRAERDLLSLHLGTDVWIPIGGQAVNQGDGAARFLPRLVLAGALGAVRYTVDTGVLLRSYASIGPPALGMTAASEARLGLGLGLALFDDSVFLGPEVRLATQIAGPNALGLNGSSVEVLGGAQWLIADHLLLGVAVGAGFLDAAGTPDARALVRVAWAPRRGETVSTANEAETDAPSEEAGKETTSTVAGSAGATDDADGDGTPDADDRCPFEPETKNGIRDEDGCPEHAMTADSPLARVLAPSAAEATAAEGSTGAPGEATSGAPTSGGATSPDESSSGATGEPAAGGPVEPSAGGPTPAAPDADGDGIPDEADACPVQAEDTDDFEDEDGCPEPDNDKDGVDDAADRCPFEAETPNGIDDDDGCPDSAPDADKDGVADTVDRCPLEPETLDGVRDDDGCPEQKAPSSDALARLLATPAAASTSTARPATDESDTGAAPAFGQGDADRDGVLDEADRCPVTPEDTDGFEDDDGCPEPDNDGDGLADNSDRCPFEAETVNDWQDDDGCPDEHGDLDGDGVPYADDRCPLEAGDAADGCPHAELPMLALPGFPGAGIATATETATAEPEGAAPEPATSTADFDRDGVPDAADRCPMTKEDADGFEDDDGCPEPDNDADGVPDAKDKCPFEAETINGVRDNDGCPDGGAGDVSIEGQNVVIKGVVLFRPGSAQLTASSLPLLKQVASTLKAAKSLTVEIQGHTDDVGSAANNIRLSKARAEAIRKVLIRQGVDENRLIATGYGPTRPRATNATREGREQNRRVEFLILGETK